MALIIREEYVEFPVEYTYIGQTTGIPRHLVAERVSQIVEKLLYTFSQNRCMVNSVGVRMEERGNYTGPSGVAFALLTAYLHAKRSPFVETLFQADKVRGLGVAIAFAEFDAVSSAFSSDPTAVLLESGLGWYCGFPGITTTMIQAATIIGDADRCKQGTAALTKMAQIVGSRVCESQNEILYGRAGFLTCLRKLASLNIDDGTRATIERSARLVITAIMADGVAQSTPEWPLLWTWQRAKYIGAAHGVAGILHELLSWWTLLTPDEKKSVTATLRVLAAASRDNAPIRVTSSGEVSVAEEIVHWCHGPPGLATLFAKASLVLDDAECDAAARRLAERVTAKGILRKGLGLCHGVCGNAYSLLALFKSTGDQKYFHNCVTMLRVGLSDEYQTEAAATYSEPQRIGNGPDTPLSLMEGDAGVLCFLLDVLDPHFSAFPGFETTLSSTLPLTWLAKHQRLFDVPPPAPPATGENKAAAPAASTATPDGVEVAPGVWEVDLMDPSFCNTFLDEVYAGFPAEKRKVDALRLGRRQEAVVRSVTAFVQRFVHNVMCPADARRLQRFTSTTEDAKAAPLKKGHLRNLDTRDEREKAAALAHRAEALQAEELPQLRAWRSYVIRYDAVNHPSINSHTDACDITFNLCMRRTCEQGQLIFNDSAHVHTHKPGTATIFWGDKMHHTHNVEGDGERAQLVLLLNFMRPDSKGTPLRRIDARSLNDPCLFEILTFLPTRDIASFSYANKRFYAVANESGLWFQLYRRNAALMSFRTAADLLVIPVCVNCKTLRGGEACVSCYKPLCEGCGKLCNECRSAGKELDYPEPDDVTYILTSYGRKVPEYIEGDGVSHWKPTYHAALMQATASEPLVKAALCWGMPSGVGSLMRATTGLYPSHNRVASGFRRATTGIYNFHNTTQHMRQMRLAQRGGEKFAMCTECHQPGKSSDTFTDDD